MPFNGMIVLNQYHENWRDDKVVIIESKVENFVLYFKDRLIHRIDGPAIVYNDQEYYYIQGTLITKSEWTFFYE